MVSAGTSIDSMGAAGRTASMIAYSTAPRTAKGTRGSRVTKQATHTLIIMADRTSFRQPHQLAEQVDTTGLEPDDCAGDQGLVISEGPGQPIGL